jgi:NADH:ubiquinone oxidoreductase subunit H
MLQIGSPAIASYFTFIYNLLSKVVGAPILWPMAFIISFIIFLIILSIIFSLFSYIFGWVERKIIGRAQAREHAARQG